MYSPQLTMEIRTYNVYSFDELTDDQKQKALDKMRYFNVEIGEWWEPIYQHYRETLAEYGLSDFDMHFSGFHSQGDGASIAAHVDPSTWMGKMNLTSEYPELYSLAQEGLVEAELTRNGVHYVHSNMITGDISIDPSIENDKAEDQAQEASKLLTSWGRDQSKKLYNDLEKSFNYLTSDETIIESIQANDFMFTSSGDID